LVPTKGVERRFREVDTDVRTLREFKDPAVRLVAEIED
jgi:hypothetical protein